MEERTPTRTAVEKFTNEEGIALYGVAGWLACLLKSQKPHDSSKNLRRREKNEKAEKKKEKIRSLSDD